MPNHAQNRLVVECDPRDFTRVRAMLAGEEASGPVALSFQAVAPIPKSEDIAVRQAEQYAAWGVCGGAYDIEVEEAPEGLIYTFATAWRNVPWIAQAVADHLRAGGVVVRKVCYEGAEFATKRYWRVCSEGAVEIQERGDVAVGWNSHGPYIAAPRFLQEHGFYPAV